MKRMFVILLSAALLLGLLGACDQQGVSTPTRPADASARPTASEEGEGELSAQALVEAVFPYSGCEAAEVEHLNADADREYLAAYIANAYGLPEGQWEDAAVVRATGASAFELAVLRLEDEDAAVRAASGLMSYIFSRQGDFAGYAPAEADMAANGGIMQDGPYAALFICPDPDGAQAALEAALSGTLAPPQAEPTPGPADAWEETFPIHDLLHRLLLEAACPDWASIGKAWSDTNNFSGFEDDMESTHGISMDQYKEFTFAEWIPGSARDDIPFQHFPVLEADYELIVFLAEDEAGATALVGPLTDYLKEKEARLRQEGREDAADLVARGQVAQSGRYTMLVVSDYADEAAMLFPQAVNDGATEGYFQRYIQGVPYPAEPTPVPNPDSDYPDRVKFTAPNKDDMSLYDTSAIRAAWASGDLSGLSDYDREIYRAAQQVLGEILAGGMGDYDKELAIYSWLVNHVDYDWRHQDIMAHTPRESFGPYGGLVSRRAVCLGYATSFQLLMDLAGVECITVVGAAFRSEEDHAWNMVRLKGEWYCVDVTWDANGREQLGLGEPEDWDYFNVTSDDMAGSNHQWDYANTPEATAEDHGQG